MSHLIDTCILIDLSRGDKKAEAYFKKLNKRPSLSAITISEFMAGILKKDEHALLEQIRIGWKIFPVDEEISLLAGKYLRQFQKSHGVALGDALIAATAKQHEFVLATRNTKHFPMLEKSEIVIPY